MQLLRVNAQMMIFVLLLGTLAVPNGAQAASKKVTYKTSDKKIATVTGSGVVKGKKAGTAKITVNQCIKKSC